MELTVGIQFVYSCSIALLPPPLLRFRRRQRLEGKIFLWHVPHILVRLVDGLNHHGLASEPKANVAIPTRDLGYVLPLFNANVIRSRLGQQKEHIIRN